ncbi:MAG TPA: cellulase family glycosylhydrolase [Puia sp.]|nr:cellulase family glycosylhydrolase [Puia sp.]
MRRHFCCLAIVLLLSILHVYSQTPAERWSVDRAAKWYDSQPWYCGFNYIPAYAINYTAMWDKTSFDPTAIDKELALAEKTGLNVLRCVLQYAVYGDDPVYFIKTFDTFLGICAKHTIKVVPIFFDDCVFGLEHDPKVGRQPEPLPGWYAWAWSPSPGHTLVIDASRHYLLEKYVKDVMTRFKDDDRILFWDLYNEPTNGGMGTASLPLVRSVIRWAREVNPSQPLSMDIWNGNAELNKIVLSFCDVVTFHNYGNRASLTAAVDSLSTLHRPVFCTEWLNRYTGSRIQTNLVLMKERHVGCMFWGLVNGKTQTNLPWGHRPGDPVSALWQHDIFKGDFTPYDPEEIKLLMEATKH